MLLEFDKKNPTTPVFLFIASAVDQKTNNLNLYYIYSDGARLMATDGQQLHITTRVENQLPEGFYEIKKLSKTAVTLQKQDASVVFPPVDRVIPKNPERIPFTSKSVAYQYAEMVRATEGAPVPYLRFEKMAELVGVGTYAQAGELNPVLLENDQEIAVIVPILR